MSSIAKANLDKKAESIIYDEAEVSPATGETLVYDEKILSNVIRRREIELIKSELKATNPKRILDYGCSGNWLSWIMCMPVLMLSDFGETVSSLLC